MAILRMRLLQWLWLAIAAAILFNLGVLVHLLFSSPALQNASAIAVHTGNAFGWLLGALLCARLLPETRAKSGAAAVYRRLSFWISLAYFINGVAEASSAFYYWMHIPQVPLWVQSLFLLQYPCLLFAVRSLPGLPSSRSFHIRVLLDSLILMTTIVAWSWYILLGPELLNGHFSPLVKLLDLAYSSADLILFMCLFRLFSQLQSPVLPLVRYLLLAGIVAIIPAASINILAHMQPVAAQVHITVSESIGYCLIAIAVQVLRFPENMAITVAAKAAPLPSSWLRILLPYSLVPTVLVLMLRLWFTERESVLAQGVYLAGLIVMVQILARQVMVLREVLVTNQRLYSTHEALQVEQQALSKVNEQLGMANERLGQQADELAAAYKRQIQINELKDQFMLHVSHELRTPLTTVHGYLNLLHEQQETLAPSIQALFVANALEGSEELQDVISNVQDALESGVRPLQWEEFPLLPVVCESLERFDPETRQAYQIELAIPEMFPVRADRLLLQQVLCNLLSNVFKYCPPHTPVQIGAALVTSKTELSASQNLQIHIWVQDAGPGIPPSELPLLFDKFIRLKRDMNGSIRGMGLGLYICRSLIEAMEGHIWIESSGIPGEGSRFSLTLPVPSRLISSYTASSY